MGWGEGAFSRICVTGIEIKQKKKNILALSVKRGERQNDKVSGVGSGSKGESDTVDVATYEEASIQSQKKRMKT